jgi:flagellar L-ring protein precursor FlgH
MERIAKLTVLAMLTVGLRGERPQPVRPASPLEAYVSEALERGEAPPRAAAGSLFAPGGPLADLVRDARASRVDDVVTVLVAESATAVAKGSTQSARASKANNSLGPVAGLTRLPMSQLAALSGDQKLDGSGSTSRETVLTTTLTARVTRVLPNGAMLIEGSKTIQVNSEQQVVTVRGVVRPADLASGNVVRSDRLANLEVRINGKGVVGDAVRRPFFLYRALLGLLPF